MKGRARQWLDAVQAAGTRAACRRLPPDRACMAVPRNEVKSLLCARAWGGDSSRPRDAPAAGTSAGQRIRDGPTGLSWNAPKSKQCQNDARWSSSRSPTWTTCSGRSSSPADAKCRAHRVPRRAVRDRRRPARRDVRPPSGRRARHIGDRLDLGSDRRDAAEPMKLNRSADRIAIAHERWGRGPVLILVGGGRSVPAPVLEAFLLSRRQRPPGRGL